MTYWIVLAAVTLAEEVADLLLGCWLPLYYEAKLVLLLWLISPVSRSTMALILTEPHVKCLQGFNNCLQKAHSSHTCQQRR